MLKKYARIGITGDSVTDCGRAHPVGCRNTGLGNGYAFFVDTALSALYPEQKIWVDNTGISGNTSKQLLERFDEDVLSRNPDVITVMIISRHKTSAGFVGVAGFNTNKILRI